jgi:aspartate kinase
MEIEVHKFGGASLASPDAVKRMAAIVQQLFRGKKLLIVVSAMGKTTNALEHALSVALEHGNIDEALLNIETLHNEMLKKLELKQESARNVTRLLNDLGVLLSNLPASDYDKLYDQVIAHGELLSSLIFAAYLAQIGLEVEWVDVRSILRTNSAHRSAIINSSISSPLVQERFANSTNKIFVTQGFIASDAVGATTTLGREGSDYSAALLGCFLSAQSVSIWKDVSGLFSADPKQFPQAQPIAAIDYREVIEMSYNGAKVIHEKALKPLQNANIPLYVRTFLTPDEKGTCISNWEEGKRRNWNALPLIAVQEKQVLLTVSPRDLSFAIQDYASRVFELVRTHHLIVRLIQNSAVRFSLSMDYDAIHFPDLLASLHEQFYTSYNLDVLLLSIRHIPPQWRDALTQFHDYLLLQETRNTSQYLVRRDVWEMQLYPLLKSEL